jgi:hypothetical protein
MSWIADAHAEWHYVNGPVGTVICPLDCYDPPDDTDYREPLEDAPAADWDRYAEELFQDSLYVQERDAKAAREPLVADDPWGPYPPVSEDCPF